MFVSAQEFNNLGSKSQTYTSDSVAVEQTHSSSDNESLIGEIRESCDDEIRRRRSSKTTLAKLLETQQLEQVVMCFCHNYLL